jgi:hypothetical protein
MERNSEVIQLELKYCERCGGLWLRPQGVALPYCAPCAAEIADLPSPRKKRSRARLPVRSPFADNPQPELQLVHRKGGNA